MRRAARSSVGAWQGFAPSDRRRNLTRRRDSGRERPEAALRIGKVGFE
jgi:hypothetical protein